MWMRCGSHGYLLQVGIILAAEVPLLSITCLRFEMRPADAGAHAAVDAQGTHVWNEIALQGGETSANTANATTHDGCAAARLG